MKWHSKQSASAVFDAIAQWGGRALITAGWGGLQPPEDMPENIMFTGPVHHSLLFPRVTALVHHGGAGTTAEGLRHARPTLVLPQFMDQYDFARRIEEFARRTAAAADEAGCGTRAGAAAWTISSTTKRIAPAPLQSPLKWRASPASPARSKR